MIELHDKAERFASAAVAAFRERGLTSTAAMSEIYETMREPYRSSWDDVHDTLASRWLITFGDAI